MVNQPAATQGRNELPAGLGVLELPVGDARCVVEYLRHESTRDDSGTTAVLLLHDLDRDLDDHRSLAWFLFEAGFNVCNIDLPGHGMSSGQVSDVPAAIAAAAGFLRADGARGVAYVTDGRLGAITLARPPEGTVAIVMLHPVPGTEQGAPADGWEHVPSLYVVDPSNAASDEYAKQLASASRAWNLRCFVHDDEPVDRGPAAHRVDPDRSTWAVQSASLTRSFLLEQSFYWRLHQRAGEGTE